MVTMNLSKLLTAVLLVSLVTGAILTSGCAPVQTIENITSQEAFNLIQDNQDNPDFVILDVRTPAEFASGHIENALNLDFYSETFRNELNNLDKNKTYLVYCKVGGRSRDALDIMAELNFKEAYNMAGGITAWKAKGLPILK